VYVGGDAWEHLAIANRYISVALPAGFALIGCMLGQLFAEGSPAELGYLCKVLVITAAASALTVVGVHVLVHPMSRLYIWSPAFIAYAGTDLVLVVAAILALGKRRAALPAWARLAPASLLLPLWLCIDGGAFAMWLKNGVPPIDEEMTRLGLAVGKATGPNTSIAVVWAGAPPYFSHRPSVDLLGKSDRVIAHEASHLPFLPGHSKWDYHHTVDAYHPDLILQTWKLTAPERAFLEASYVRLPNGVYLRRNTEHADRAAVAAIPLAMRHTDEAP
jgi:hypothetical protein